MPKYSLDKHQFQLTTPGQVSPAADQPPRLSAALLKADTGKMDRFKTSMVKAGTVFDWGDATTFKANLAKLLGHVRERLLMGLEEAWLSPYGYDGPLPMPKEGDKSTENELNEMWVRAFAEMFVFTAYGGTAMIYEQNNIGNTDMKYYRRLSTDWPDPVFPIIAACQHIATFSALTRGIKTVDLEPNGMTAGGGTRALGAWTGGSWNVASTESDLGTDPATQKKKTGNVENPELRDIAKLIGTYKIGPGSVFAFNSNGPLSPLTEGHVHIGGVIRVLGDGQIQCMDTGVLNAGVDSGTLDHGIMKGTLQGMSGNLVGVGVLPTGTLTTNLCQWMKTARPAGFAQLVLADGDDKVRFISRVLPMHHGTENFAISRYVWSLRALPVSPGVQAYWILYVPTKVSLTKALYDVGARAKTVKEMATSAGIGDKDTLLHFLRPVVVVASNKSGSVSVYRHKLDGKIDEWNGVATATNKTQFPAVLDALRFADRPGGFYGKWSGLTLAAEYACVDPEAKKPTVLSDAASDVDYFNAAGPSAVATPSATPPPPDSVPPSGAPPESPPSSSPPFNPQKPSTPDGESAPKAPETKG